MGASIIPTYIREAVVQAYNGYCACDDCYSKATEIHHIKSNTKVNVKRWPLFINSPFNLKPICQPDHQGCKKYQWKISDAQASVYEAYLFALKEE